MPRFFITFLLCLINFSVSAEIIFSEGNVLIADPEKTLILPPYVPLILPPVAQNNATRLIQQTQRAHAWSMSNKNQNNAIENMWLVTPSYTEDWININGYTNRLDNRQQVQRNLRRAHAFRLDLYKK